MRWKFLPMVKARRWTREKRVAVLLAIVASLALGVVVQPYYVEVPPREIVVLPYVPPLCREIIEQKPADGWTRLSYEYGAPLVHFACGRGNERAWTVQPLVLVKR